MAEKNVIIRITAESDMSKANQELEAMKDRERDLMNEMRKQQQEYQKRIALLGQNTTAIDKLRDSYTKQQSQMESDLKKTKSQLEDFSKKLSNANETIADGAVKTPKLVTQLRAMKQELAKMEMEGVDPTDKAFIKLAVSAGELEDQIGDTRQRISILASDTKNLDAAMSVGQGIAGTFTVATSTAALLGGESEQLTKAFLKVQAALSILNGVQMIANTLNKDSAAMVVIKNALEESSTIAKIKNYTATKIQTANTILETAANEGSKVAKVGATATQWALNAAVTAFPAVALIAAISAVVVAFAAYSSGAAEAEREQAKLNAQANNFKADMDERSKITAHIIELMKAQGKTTQDIRNYEIKRAKENIKYYEDEYNYLARNKNAKEDDLKAAAENLATARTELSDINRKYRVEDAQADTDAKKKEEERQKQANEKAKQQAEKRNQELIAAQKEYQDTRIANMEDGYEKEAAKIELDFQRKLSTIKGHSAIEEKLRTELTLNRNKRLSEIGNLSEITTPLDTNVTKAKEDTPILIGEMQTRIEGIQGVIEQGNQASKDKYDEDLQAFRDKEAAKQAIVSESVNTLGAIGDAYFSIQRDRLDEQMSNLDSYYTTDAEAAKKNSNLKLISEEEMNKKKTDIKIKQAKLDKQQALFNIALNTAQAIMSIWAQWGWNPVTAGILTGLVGVAAIAQTAAVMAKPLPKYAKGKKAGGSGHWATVGEVGPETMWVPDGAAIIPHGAPMNSSTFDKFNIPYIPELPNVDSRFMRNKGSEIDYDRLGKAVADNVRIPRQKEVHVHVDKRGITVKDGSNYTTHLNKKYEGAWN